MTRTLLLGVLLSAAAAPAALAQPDPEATPAAGTVALASGFSPTPHAVDLTAGGAEEAAAAEATCPGYVSAAPSVVLDYGGGTDPLHLFVRSSTDTVLLVRTPGGEWLCNDDEEALNPGLWVEDAAAGRYAVWVGTFSDAADTEIPATLYATEGDVEEPALDPAAAPSGGTVSLGAGFSPDPHEMDVQAGGPTSALAYEGCAGFVDAAAPTIALDYGGTGPLYVYAQTTGDDDLTLLVMDPGGTLHCNDDADGLNPGLVVEPAAAGRYAVWVGTYATRARTEAPGRASLFFSETEGPVGGGDYFEEDYEDDGTYGGGEGISLFAPPAHGTLSLDAGFGAREVAVEAGGSDAVSVTGFGCVGYITNGEPDLNVLYGGEGELLAFHAEADDDLTMVVNLPDGSWRCSDDALGRNPAIVVEAPEGGLYNVWVGTYSQGTGTSATLHVAEQDPR